MLEEFSNEVDGYLSLNVYNTVYIELNTDDSVEFFINPETGQYDFTVTAHIKRLGRFTGVFRSRMAIG